MSKTASPIDIILETEIIPTGADRSVTATTELCQDVCTVDYGT